MSVQVNAPEIHGFLQVCFDRYKAEDYKADFDWIDQIKDLRDRKTTGKLDTVLIQRLDKIWMALLSRGVAARRGARLWGFLA